MAFLFSCFIYSSQAWLSVWVCQREKKQNRLSWMDSPCIGEDKRVGGEVDKPLLPFLPSLPHSYITYFLSGSSNTYSTSRENLGRLSVSLFLYLFRMIATNVCMYVIVLITFSRNISLFVLLFCVTCWNPSSEHQCYWRC